MAVYPSGARFYSKIRVAPGKGGRRTYQLARGLDQAGASLRDALLDELARAMTGAGLDVERVIDPVLVRLAEADGAEASRVERYIRTRLLPGQRRPVEEAPTVRAFGEAWTSGELARRYPDQVEARKVARRDQADLEHHVYPVIGDVLLSAVRLEHLEQVLRRLPSAMAKSTKAKLLSKLHRLLDLACYPGRYLDHNPMPRGFAPKAARSSFAFLYPTEEAQLLGCREVPRVRRVAYGLAARTGLRISEVCSLQWQQVDLARGAIRLEEHKTVAKVGARLVPLDPATVRVLRWWLEQSGAEEGTEASVFGLSRWLGENTRDDLRTAGVLRAELHATKAGGKPFAFHSFRRTFVTLSLGAGHTEDWVMRRTGHTTSAQLHRYRIAAATASEFGLGWLRAFDEALAETADTLRGASCPQSEGNAGKTDDSASRCPTQGDESSKETPRFDEGKGHVSTAEKASQTDSGQGADRLSELIEAAIAEARTQGLLQVEIRLRNALGASTRPRRAS